VAGDDEALRGAGLDRLADALVVGDQGVAALVVVHGHPPSAAPADGEALQQRGALAGGAGGALGAVGPGVGVQQALVDLELLEGEVARVRVDDQGGPLLARQLLHGGLAVGGLAGAAPAIGERAGVARVVQRLEHAPVAHRHP